MTKVNSAASILQGVSGNIGTRARTRELNYSKVNTVVQQAIFRMSLGKGKNTARATSMTLRKKRTMNFE